MYVYLMQIHVARYENVNDDDVNKQYLLLSFFLSFFLSLSLSSSSSSSSSPLLLLSREERR